jgi:arsenate reductase
MSDVTIWHNPRCSKSRAALALLQDRGISPAIRLYLQDPPTTVELRAALDLLGGPAAAMMRTAEPEFRTLGLARDADDDTLIAAMAAVPKLIERPIVFARGKAALGRPPEQVLSIL